MPPDEHPVATVLRHGLDGPERLESVHEALLELWSSGAPNTSPDARWRIEFEIAVAEVAANVARHVSTDPMPLTFSMQLALHHTRVEAHFEDRGPEPTLPVNPELPDAGAEAGRGLVIARQCLDQLWYERVAEWNRWHLVKHRPGTH